MGGEGKNRDPKELQIGTFASLQMDFNVGIKSMGHYARSISSQVCPLLTSSLKAGQEWGKSLSFILYINI